MSNKDSKVLQDLTGGPASGRILSKDMDRFVEDCLNGSSPPCRAACPLNLDIRSFIAKLQKGSFQGAYTLLREQTVFPGIVCKLCDAPCGPACVRTSLDAAISMKKLEQAACLHCRSTSPVKYQIPPKEERVAVIGAGLCGLSCALKLASHGYQVTVFDRNPQWGGKLREEEDKDSFLEEIGRQMQAFSLDFHADYEVTDLKELEDFQGVLITTGKGGRDFSLRESWNPDSLGCQGEGLFLAGGLTGAGPVSAIEQGIRASQSIESYLKTGRMHELAGVSLKEPCRFRPALTGQAPAFPPTGDPFSKEEAMTEAKRCIRCDCHFCHDACNLMRYYQKLPRKIVGDVRMTLNPVESLQPRVATRLLSSCSDCGLCKHLCPSEIDMGEFLFDARRIMHREGSLPPVFHEFWLEDMTFSNGDRCYLAQNAPGKAQSKQVFFPGCQLGASLPKTVKRSYERLLELQPETGLILGCCGAPAHWAGAEARMEESAAQFRREWEFMGRPEVIFACPSCRRMFETYLPEIKQISLYQVLAQEGLPLCDREKKIERDEKCKVSIFDPCSAREDEKMRHSVRLLVERAGFENEELAHHGEDARCCGYGGHIYPANPSLYEQIVKDRIEQSQLPYVTYCINCRDTFARMGKPASHVLNLVLGMEDPHCPVPNLTQRRENRIRLKQVLLKEVWGEDAFQTQAKAGSGMAGAYEECLKLEISENLWEKMERNLILEEDVRKTVEYCEETGNVLLDERSGCSIGHLKQGSITYWVVYRREGGTVRVENVYCHRLQVEGE